MRHNTLCKISRPVATKKTVLKTPSTKTLYNKFFSRRKFAYFKPQIKFPHATTYQALSVCFLMYMREVKNH